MNALHKKSNTTKGELIRAVEEKTKRAKPIPRKLLHDLVRQRKIKKADLERILKTARVSRDGWDITFKY
jgi:hypothetical protein